MIYERRHTREIAELKGLQKVAPIFAAVFTVVMLVVDRRARPQRLRRRVPDPDRLVPHRPLVDRGRRHRRDPRRALPAVGLPAGVPRRARRGQPDVPRADAAKEGLVLLPFIGLIVFCGVYPKPMLDRIEPSVEGADRPRRATRPATTQPHRCCPSRSRSRPRRGGRAMIAAVDDFVGPAIDWWSPQPAARSCSAAALVLLVRRRAHARVAAGPVRRRSPRRPPVPPVVLGASSCGTTSTDEGATHPRRRRDACSTRFAHVRHDHDLRRRARSPRCVTDDYLRRERLRRPRGLRPVPHAPPSVAS